MLRKDQTLRWALLFSVIGVALSLFSYLQHIGAASSTFCTINETFNCDVVNRGPYGTFMGLPVSLIGVVGYGLLLAGFLVKIRKPADRELTQFLLMASVVGLVFAFYLTGIEAFVLHAYCLICLVSQGTILCTVFFTARLWNHEKRSNI